eukprot:2674556-Amphidinium_carterae.1
MSWWQGGAAMEEWRCHCTGSVSLERLLALHQWMACQAGLRVRARRCRSIVRRIHAGNRDYKELQHWRSQDIQ